MSCQEDQDEEAEVLESIYDGDACYKKINNTTYQYKYGEDGSYRSFVLQVVWGENYPQELPVISLDAFYNKHIKPEVKEHVINTLNEQGEQFLGCAMTYTLFEYVKENLEDLLVDQPNAPPVQEREEKEISENQSASKSVKEKKEQLTKAQKRKMFDRMNAQGEMPRGWNWVDIVKHLSKTGGKDDES